MQVIVSTIPLASMRTLLITFHKVESSTLGMFKITTQKLIEPLMNNQQIKKKRLQVFQRFYKKKIFGRKKKKVQKSSIIQNTRHQVLFQLKYFYSKNSIFVYLDRRIQLQ